MKADREVGKTGCEKNQIYKSNVWKLFLMNIFRGAIFSMPIIVLFYQENGLSMSQVMLLSSIYLFAVLLFEVPSGYFADVFSRKLSLVLGVLAGTFAYLFYFFANSFLEFAVLELLFALAYSLFSGTQNALLYDSLKAACQEHEFRHYLAKLNAGFSFSEAVSAIVGGIVAASISLRFTFLLNALFFFLAFFVAITLKESPRKKPKSTGHLSNIFKMLKLKIFQNKEVLYLIFYSMSVYAAAYTAVLLLQPYFKNSGVPLEYFGVLWAGFTLLVAGFSWIGDRLIKALSDKGAFLLVAILSGLLYFVMGLANMFLAVMAVLIILAFLRALQALLVQDYANKHTDSKERATFLSVISSISILAFVVLSPLVGFLVDIFGFKLAMVYAGFLFGLLALLSVKKLGKFTDK